MLGQTRWCVIDSSLEYPPVRIQAAPISTRRSEILSQAARLMAKPSVRRALAGAGFALAGTALRIATQSHEASRQRNAVDAGDTPWLYIEHTIVCVSRRA